MKVELVKAVFQDIELQQVLLAGKGKDGRDIYLAKNMFNCVVDDSRERFVHLFLESISKQKASTHERDFSRLLDIFISQLVHLKKDQYIPEAIQNTLDKVCYVYKKGKFREPITSIGKFTEHTYDVSKFLDIANDESLTHEIDQLINDHADQDEEMKKLIKDRNFRHEAGFSYDVIKVEEMPAVIVCGTPRTDILKSLYEFYSMLLKEEVDVVVALNTFSDWEKAIPYYDTETLKSLDSDFSIEVSSPKIHYKAKLVSIEERTIIITRNGKTQKVTHFHYINWPDYEKAPDQEALEILLKCHIKHGGRSVIHCQGGIGRTLGYLRSYLLCGKLKTIHDDGVDVKSVKVNIPELTYDLKRHAPRLGGGPKGDILAQVFSVVYSFASKLQQVIPAE